MKTCTKCKEEKPLNSFSNSKRKKDGKFDYCKPCQKEINARYYQENKDKYYEHNKRNRKILKEKFLEFKSTLKCSICFESRHWCLDFHHVNDDKLSNVSDLVRFGNWNKIMEEIEKCIVVCRNCHADIHYQESIKK